MFAVYGATFVSPFQGLVLLLSLFIPGRCPGLSCAAPLGHSPKCSGLLRRQHAVEAMSVGAGAGIEHLQRACRDRKHRQ
jgi:hypothetical protein